MDTNTKSFRAAWVIPVDRPPIRDGVVLVKEGSIIAVDPYRSKEHSSRNLIDLGATAIIPGLVNAHTHLEFGYLEKPLGRPGIPFTDWIRKIVKSRIESNQQPENKAAIIRQGLEESFRFGVWNIADIATTPVAVKQYAENDPSVPTNHMTKVVFYEQLGRTEDQYSEKLGQVSTFLNAAAGSQLLKGVSPHAPYSVHPQLLELLCNEAKTHNSPVAMHLAETPAERELLENQTGPFVDLLKDFGVWQTDSFSPTSNIIDYLKVISTAPRSLVIHGNYLSDEEVAFIASVANRMSIVFCPRTHRYFEHARYPLEQLLQARICVAVGTDSRASNPDLNLFQELKLIAELFPEVPKSEILKMGTLNGAAALGIQDTAGSLSIGKPAALSSLHCPVEQAVDRDPYEWIFTDGVTCSPVNMQSAT